MRLRETVRDNAVPGTGFLAGVFWLMEQFASQIYWWSEIPFGWISLMAFSFWMGQDLYHPSGRIRKLYGKLQSFGDFSSFKCTPEFFNLGDNHGGKQKFFKVFLTFQFRKKTKVDAIRVRARCYRYLASKINHRVETYEWKQDPINITTYYENTELEIPVAYIPETHGNPGVYGDKQVNGYFLADGTAHYIEVELHSGRRIQRKTVQIFMPHMNASFDPPWDVNSNRFLLFQDGELFFPGD